GVVIASRTGPGAIQDPGVPGDGTYSYTSRQVDLAGNPGPASTGLSVTIVTATPAAPAAPDLQAGSDSGPSSADNVTNVNAPSFTVAGAAGSTVQLLRKLASDPVGSYAVVGQVAGSGTIKDNGPVADGVYTYAARQVDVAGNLSPVGPTL